MFNKCIVAAIFFFLELTQSRFYSSYWCLTSLLMQFLKGNFLADLVVTGDMVDSQTVKKVGKDINTAADKVQEVVKEKPIIKHNLTGKKKVPAAAHLVVKTVKGGELPNTAGNYLLDVLIGILLILGGTGLYRLFRRRIA